MHVHTCRKARANGTSGSIKLHFKKNKKNFLLACEVHWLPPQRHIQDSTACNVSVARLGMEFQADCPISKVLLIPFPLLSKLQFEQAVHVLRSICLNTHV
ncbi:hypothetical protein XU18_0101 [Perkinsela sp. CCAP 1560/4]|nr:hypothetical protein XU18_0101 [Perkinsela sp. CCAP 1560/4]|eukprot:KNH09416.1 hypothetical protein XU18_0101 [Perkinsela sp. CCAP 1560/4]